MPPISASAPMAAGLLVKFLARSDAGRARSPRRSSPLAGALLFGWFSVRLSGVYLAMLTLAFAQIVWSIVFQWEDVTGGSNGMLGIWPTAPFDSRPAFYLLTLALVRRRRAAAAAHAVRAVRLCDAGRPRLRRCAPKRSASTSSACTGSASPSPALFGGARRRRCSPSPRARSRPRSSWVGRSIDGMVMVLLGGMQTLTGPIVGAAVFAVLQDTVMRQTDVLARRCSAPSSCCWCWCSRAASSARSASGSRRRKTPAMSVLVGAQPVASPSAACTPSTTSASTSAKASSWR